MSWRSKTQNMKRCLRRSWNWKINRIQATGRCIDLLTSFLFVAIEFREIIFVLHMISQNTIQEILSRIDIIDIVGDFVKIKKTWSEFSGPLPFSQRKNSLIYGFSFQRNL